MHMYYKKIIVIFLTLMVFSSKLHANVTMPVAWLDGYYDLYREGFIFDPGSFDSAQSFSENGLAKIEKNGKYGYINRQGEIVIRPQFDRAYSFSSNGLTSVKKNGKYAFINSQGEMITSFQFDGTGSFKNGFAAVEKNGKWGFINEQGSMVISPQNKYEKIYSYSKNGLARIKTSNKKHGYVNNKLQIVISPQFDEAYEFSNGLAAVKQSNKWGYINSQGKMVISPQYERVSGFSEINGLARVMKGDKWGYINSQGKVVVHPQYDNLMAVGNNGLSAFYSGGKVDSINSRAGYLNSQGKVVIPPKFKRAFVFDHNGIAQVDIKEDSWGLINAKGQVVLRIENLCGTKVTKNLKNTIVWPRKSAAEICAEADYNRRDNKNTKPNKKIQNSRVGTNVCSTTTGGKNGWCGYITQVLGKSVRIENYSVFCKKGGLLGICTNIEWGSCGGNQRLFTDDSVDNYKNPKNLIVPIHCLD